MISFILTSESEDAKAGRRDDEKMRLMKNSNEGWFWRSMPLRFQGKRSGATAMYVLSGFIELVHKLSSRRPPLHRWRSVAAHRVMALDWRKINETKILIGRCVATHWLYFACPCDCEQCGESGVIITVCIVVTMCRWLPYSWARRRFWTLRETGEVWQRIENGGKFAHHLSFLKAAASLRRQTVHKSFLQSHLFDFLLHSTSALAAKTFQPSLRKPFVRLNNIKNEDHHLSNLRCWPHGFLRRRPFPTSWSHLPRWYRGKIFSRRASCWTLSRKWTHLTNYKSREASSSSNCRKRSRCGPSDFSGGGRLCLLKSKFFWPLRVSQVASGSMWCVTYFAWGWKGMPGAKGCSIWYW